LMARRSGTSAQRRYNQELKDPGCGPRGPEDRKPLKIHSLGLDAPGIE